MQEPKLPPDEQHRLQALRALKVLDTEPTEAFDRITKLAQKSFDVPIALVSLVDEDRQWFKSRQGLDAPQTGRDISFCGHAIHDRQVFVVDDTQTDLRFHDNPLVTGDPNIRFYAGVPVACPAGHLLGTLCIIDRRPRSFRENEFFLLQDLGEMVEDAIADAVDGITHPITGVLNGVGFARFAKLALERAPVAFEANLVTINVQRDAADDDETWHDHLRDVTAVIHDAFADGYVVGHVEDNVFAVLEREDDAKTSMQRFCTRMRQRRGGKAGVEVQIQDATQARRSPYVTGEGHLRVVG